MLLEDADSQQLSQGMKYPTPPRWPREQWQMESLWHRIGASWLFNIPFYSWEQKNQIQNKDCQVPFLFFNLAFLEPYCIIKKTLVELITVFFNCNY